MEITLCFQTLSLFSHICHVSPHKVLYSGSIPDQSNSLAEQNKTNSLATTLFMQQQEQQQQQQQQQQQLSVSQSMVNDPNLSDNGVGSSESALLTQQMSAFNPVMQVQAANSLSPLATTNNSVVPTQVATQVATGATSAMYGQQGLQLGPGGQQQTGFYQEEEILHNA